LVLNKIKNLHKGDFLIYNAKKAYFPNNSMIFAFSSSPLKSCATTFPDWSRMKVAGIDSTLYYFAIVFTKKKQNKNEVRPVQTKNHQTSENHM